MTNVHVNVASQDIFETIQADIGTILANSPNETLIVTGAGGITTEVVSGELVVDGSGIVGGAALEIREEGTPVDSATVAINFTGAGATASQTSAGVVQVDIPGGTDQNLFETINGDTGSVTAATPTDALTFQGLNGMAIAVTGSTVTFDAAGVAGGTLGSITDGVTTVNDLSDLTVVGATVTDDTGGAATLTVVETPQNLFETVTADTGVETAGTPTASLAINGLGGIVTNVASGVLTVDGSAISAGGAAPLVIREEGTIVEASATDVNFIGTSITAAPGASTGQVDITVTATSALEVQDEGVPVDTTTNQINFIGSAVTAGPGASAGGVDVTITETPQNLFETVTADTGSITATTPTESLAFVGSGNISTSIAGNTVTITGSGGGGGSSESDTLRSDIKAIASDAIVLIADNQWGGTTWADAEAGTAFLAEGGAGTRPLAITNKFSTKNGLTFDGVDDYLDSLPVGAFDNIDQVTVMLFGEFGTSGGTSEVVFRSSHAGGTSNNTLFGLFTNADDSITAHARSSTGTLVGATSAAGEISTTSNRMVAFTWNADNSVSLYIDADAPIVSPTTADNTGGIHNLFRLNANTLTPLTHYPGTIGTVILVPSALTSTQIQNISALVNTYYGGIFTV